jgi:hypothetical protein
MEKRPARRPFCVSLPCSWDLETQNGFKPGPSLIGTSLGWVVYHKKNSCPILEVKPYFSGIF